MKSVLVGVGVAVLLSACGQEAPDCGTAETVQSVKDIFRTKLLPEAYRALPPELFNQHTALEFAAPTAYNKDISKRECRATFATAAAPQTGPGQTLNMAERALVAATLAYGNEGGELARQHVDSKDGKLQFEVTYSTQVVNSQIFYEVRGVNQVDTDLVGLFVSSHLPQPARPAAASAPEATATVPDTPAPAPAPEAVAPPAVPGDVEQPAVASPPAEADAAARPGKQD